MLLLALAAALTLPTGCHAGQAASTVPGSAEHWPAAVSTLPHDGGRPARGGAPAAPPMLALTDRRALPGAGAVAFDPARQRVVWADAATLRTLDLRSGLQGEMPIGHPIADLAFAPDGDLWLLAGAAIRMRDGARVCRSDDDALDRVLGVDAAGVTAAGYSHSDGIGPIRQQVWIDTACRREHASTAPLPAGVTGTGADRGETPARRATLRAPVAMPAMPGWKIDDARADAVRIIANGAAFALPATPVAVSPDGRWWVLERDGQRTLWRIADRR